jgi:hypothetical protein
MYSLDPANAHIIDVSHFDADGDDAAIAQAGSEVSGVSRELWNLGRKVRDSHSIDDAAMCPAEPPVKERPIGEAEPDARDPKRRLLVD